MESTSKTLRVFRVSSLSLGQKGNHMKTITTLAITLLITISAFGRSTKEDDALFDKIVGTWQHSIKGEVVAVITYNQDGSFLEEVKLLNMTGSGKWKIENKKIRGRYTEMRTEKQKISSSKKFDQKEVISITDSELTIKSKGKKISLQRIKVPTRT